MGFVSSMLFFTRNVGLRNRDSVVDLVTGLWAGSLRYRGSMAGRGKRFISLAMLSHRL